MIRTNKYNETKPDFEEMMSEVKEDIQEQDAEQDIINRVPELKELSGNIDKATNTCANARLGLESAIQQYQRAERKLDDSVTTISGKLDTINEHIDQVMEDAPTKLKVTVTLCDADREKIQEMFGKQREWLINQAQTTVQTVNAMLAEERKKTMNRYKEYDGCYLGHYAQWFFWFFFVLGFSLFIYGMVIIVGKWLNWF
jgi:uncharacterized phage infection (PIP) family protein YhgE